MGRIYEGDTKLNVIQVCEKLSNNIEGRHANIIGKYLELPENPRTSKKVFAHAVLDAYKEMPNETEADMEIKKLSKHLLDKYMKSLAVMEGESSIFYSLIKNILDKAGK